MIYYDTDNNNNTLENTNNTNLNTINSNALHNEIKTSTNLLTDIVNIIHDYEQPAKQYILYCESGEYSDRDKNGIAVCTTFEKGLIALLSVYGHANHYSDYNVYNYQSLTWIFKGTRLVKDQDGEFSYTYNNYEEDAFCNSRYSLEEMKLDTLNGYTRNTYEMYLGYLYNRQDIVTFQPKIVLEWQKQLQQHYKIEITPPKQLQNLQQQQQQQPDNAIKNENNNNNNNDDTEEY